MRFLIVGAGGIGAYYGARLLTAGHAVLFIARGEHLTAMSIDGLEVSHPDFQFHQRVDATDLKTLVRTHQASSFDLIILTIKAGATGEVMDYLQTWLANARSPVLSLQNGVDNETAIESRIGRERTAGGLAVRIGGHIIRPGHVEATGIAQVIMGAWKSAAENPALQQNLNPVADCFNAAAISTTLTSEIQKELWRKLLINNGVNPLSALTSLDTRSLTSHPIFSRTVYTMMEETALAAGVEDVHLEREDIDEMYRLICQFDPIKTSMLVDMEKGRPLELDAISGAVISRCRKVGSDAPTTELIQALLTNQLGTGSASKP